MDLMIVCGSTFLTNVRVVDAEPSLCSMVAVELIARLQSCGQRGLVFLNMPLLMILSLFTLRLTGQKKRIAGTNKVGPVQVS